MNIHTTLPVEFKPGVRDRTSLIIALASASGGGKTRSALALGRGLANGDDGKIAFIDTEARRGLHYAVGPGQQPDKDHFAFVHHDMRPPFTPEAYSNAIQAADRAGYDVIIVDSCTHEWEGEGGLQEIHDELVLVAVEKSRQSHNDNWGAFDEGRAADRASVGAWKEPKSRHKKFISRLLQCRAHLILCLRADEKIRMETIEEERNGRKYKKTVIIQPKDLPPNERWVPICEKRFMYEMTLSLVMTPQAPGIPIPIKLQEQHRGAVPLDQYLSEETGRQLALWSRGGAAPAAIVARDKTLDAGRAVAKQGVEALRNWWGTLPDSERTRLKATLDNELKATAQITDNARANQAADFDSPSRFESGTATTSAAPAGEDDATPGSASPDSSSQARSAATSAAPDAQDASPAAAQSGAVEETWPIDRVPVNEGDYAQYCRRGWFMQIGSTITPDEAVARWKDEKTLRSKCHVGGVREELAEELEAIIAKKRAA